MLRKVLETEPERLLPLITVEQHRVLDFITAFLLPYLEREERAGRVRPGVDLEAAQPSTSPASCSRSSARPVVGTWTTRSRCARSSARSSWAESWSDLPPCGRAVTRDMTLRRFLPYCLRTGT